MVQTQKPSPLASAILDPGTSIWTIRQWYIPNFKHLNQVLLKKMSEYFSWYFYDSTIGPPGVGPFQTLRPSFEQTWYRTFYSSGPDADFFIIFYVFLSFKPKIPWNGAIFGPRDLHLKKFGKGPRNVTHQISRIWGKWFWRRRFLNVFLCISTLQTQSSG